MPGPASAVMDGMLEFAVAEKRKPPVELSESVQNSS
jgi:hypothetical protein